MKNIAQQNNSSAKKNFPYFAPWYCRDYQYMWRRENKFHFSACLTQFFCSMAVTMSPLNTHWIPPMDEIWRFSVLCLSNSFNWNVVAFEALWRCCVAITQSTYLSYTENCLQYNQNNLFSTRGKFFLTRSKRIIHLHITCCVGVYEIRLFFVAQDLRVMHRITAGNPCYEDG